MINPPLLLSNIDTYISYFENLATKNKAIKHGTDGQGFMVIDDIDDYEEVMQALRSAAKPVFMCLQYPESDIGDISQSDNYQDRLTGTIIIWKKYNSAEATNARTAIIDAKKIMRSIYSKMRKDKRDGLLLDFRPMFKSGRKINLPGECLAGWMYSFEISSLVDVSYKASEWDV